MEALCGTDIFNYIAVDLIEKIGEEENFLPTQEEINRFEILLKLILDPVLNDLKELLEYMIITDRFGLFDLVVRGIDGRKQYGDLFRKTLKIKREGI